eukprot:TRINITY_DN76742_c0_g1_i1.p1 TRINITY_DN76742_c0_g1~~TRINITY_DN76742_c0_g1_i1.p1  ORF type:complete len:265 (+),score=68.80 TRINITY_DN76742_c0_g1_i1:44-796(+)
MAAKLLEQAFGKGRHDLYELLGVSRNASQDQIRKGYHRAALRWHPDKNPRDATATVKFQALGAAHKILSDPVHREEYDTLGNLPGDSPGVTGQDWRQYFSTIFHAVTSESVEAFARHYRASDEERADVLKAYREGDGDLGKVIDSVMLATEDGASRFQDLIEAAIAAGEVQRLRGLALSTTEAQAAKRQRKAAKEASEAKKELERRSGDLQSLAEVIRSRNAARGEAFEARLDARLACAAAPRKRPAACR